jgi:hypothetical protein
MLRCSDSSKMSLLSSAASNDCLHRRGLPGTMISDMSLICRSWPPGTGRASSHQQTVSVHSRRKKKRLLRHSSNALISSSSHRSMGPARHLQRPTSISLGRFRAPTRNATLCTAAGCDGRPISKLYLVFQGIHLAAAESSLTPLRMQVSDHPKTKRAWWLLPVHINGLSSYSCS